MTAILQTAMSETRGWRRPRLRPHRHIFMFARHALPSATKHDIAFRLEGEALPLGHTVYLPLVLRNY